MEKYSSKTFEQKVSHYYSIQLHHSWLLANRQYIYIPETITLFNDYRNYVVAFNELDKALKNHLKEIFSMFFDIESIGLLRKNNVPVERLEYELNGIIDDYLNAIKFVFENHSKFISSNLTSLFQDYVLKETQKLKETINLVL
ncbi:hypothetical protein R4575_16750 [Acinetobacter baumannii]|nr:hypothetical protein [Acinetobacter baumannii]